MADSRRDFAASGHLARSATSPALQDDPIIRHTSVGGHLRPTSVRSRDARSPPALTTESPTQSQARSTGLFSPRSAASPRTPWGRPSMGSNRMGPTHGRTRRSDTIRTYGTPSRPNWEPGAEPGIDTAQDSDEDEDFPKPAAPCDITVIDFSEDHVEQTEHDNTSFSQFLALPRADWVTARWICVNGLDWGVVKLLGRHKRLHRLAIEDLLHTKSRPKVDWYSDHAFIVLTLQKLVRLFREKEQDSKASETSQGKGFFGCLSRPKPGRVERKPSVDILEKSEYADAGFDVATTRAQDAVKPVRTLQRWRGGPNTERIEYMESRSALTKLDLAVSVEQVCIFLTADNTVISFFENSAPDILGPIAGRLGSDETILRRSADASLLVQAIVDAIVDLAIPVASAYDDAIGSLELEVLSDPSMRQPKQLYILTSEIMLLRNTISPVSNLIHSLRDHRSDVPNAQAPVAGRPPLNRLITTPSSVTISPLTHVYLGDVEDHVIMLSASLDRMRLSAENLTSLIFNTLAAHQNESMKQLTLVTIFFLPLTFLASYCGMNFSRQDITQLHSDAYFWYVAIPVMVVTCLFLMRNYIYRSLDVLSSKWFIRRSKRRRIMHERMKIAQDRRRARIKQTIEADKAKMDLNGEMLTGETFTNQADGAIV